MDNITFNDMADIEHELARLTVEVGELKLMLANVCANVDGAIEAIKPLIGGDMTSTLIKMMAGGK